jgi:DNA end-binding protein Ku
MNTLRFAKEIRPIDELTLPQVGRRELTDKELAMAERLVDDMTVDWNPEQYRDSYSDDLMKRIEARIAAGDTHVVSAPSKDGERPDRGAEVIDLVSLLRRSIDQGKSGEAASKQEEAVRAPGSSALARKAPRRVVKRAAQRKRANTVA